MAGREGNIESELRTLESDPNRTMGQMYEGWAPSQEEVRRGKAGSPVVDGAGELIADEQLRDQLRNLAEIVREPGMSDGEALKNFFATMIKGGSPADSEQEGHSFDRGEAERYGRSAGSETGRKALSEHEERKEERKEEEERKEHEREEEGKKSAALVSVLRKLSARLDDIDDRLNKLSAPASAGRSVEASQGGSAPAVETPVAPSEGIYRRGQSAGGQHPAQFFGIEVSKVLSAAAQARDYAQLNRLKREATDAITVIQEGGKPLLNTPQLQEVAAKLGIPYVTASGAMTAGRSE